MCPHKYLFTTYKQMSCNVYMRDDSLLIIVGIGTIRLKMLDCVIKTIKY